MDAAAREAIVDVSSEHTHLRALVAELVREVLQTGRKVRHREVRERLVGLRAAVEHAIDVEERELAPLVRAADPWGNARVERVRDRHARLRRAVKDFEDDVAEDRHERCDLVSRAEELVAALFSDLEEEDDAIVASQQGDDGTVVLDQESD